MLSYAQQITVETPPTTDGLGRAAEGALQYQATVDAGDDVTTQLVGPESPTTSYKSGDGQEATGSEATFTYDTAGTYTLTLGAAPIAATTVYDGAADVQEGAVERVDRSGQTFRVGDAEAFLPRRVSGIEAGQAITITWADGSTQAATVAETRRLDDTIVLTYDD